MSHMIIIGGKIFFPPHDDGDGLVADEHKSSIEVGDIKYRPSHGATAEQVGNEVARITRILNKLGTPE